MEDFLVRMDKYQDYLVEKHNDAISQATVREITYIKLPQKMKDKYGDDLQNCIII